MIFRILPYQLKYKYLNEKKKTKHLHVIKELLKKKKSYSHITHRLIIEKKKNLMKKKQQKSIMIRL